MTYTQYITMMVLWEHQTLNVSELGTMLYLDSGTLTPLLKKLEVKEYISRIRAKNDERNLIISITDKGNRLKEQVKDIPIKVGKCIDLSDEANINYISYFLK